MKVIPKIIIDFNNKWSKNPKYIIKNSPWDYLKTKKCISRMQGLLNTNKYICVIYINKRLNSMVKFVDSGTRLPQFES